MATWQPPIPAGALYSKAARDLGPALPLLAYCYDLVGRDGWLEITLKDAAGDMEEPYQNVKRWWSIVRAGPFFIEAVDRGKRGWRVRFRDIWIDWRILSTREVPKTILDDSKVNEPSSTNEVPETILDGHQVQIKYKSSTNEVPETILDNSGNKVLNTTHLAGDQLRTSRAPPGDHKRLMKAYAEVLPDGRIPNGGKEGAAAKKILEAGYTVEQAIEVYHYLKAGFWSDKHLSLHKVYEEMGAVLNAPKEHTNGAHQNRGTHAPGSRMVRGQPRAIPADRAAEYKRQIAEWEQPDD